MFLYDVKLTLAVLLLSAFNIAAVKAASRARTDASRRLMQDKGKLMGTAMNGLQMIETLKATGSRGRVLRPLGRLPRQVDQHQAAARRARPDRRRGAAVRADR